MVIGDWRLVITNLQLLISDFFNLPVQSWSHRANTRLGPLRARRASNIHVECEGVLIHKITAHAERTRIHANGVAAFVENICGDFGAADVMSRVACIVFLKELWLVGVEGGKHIFAAHGAEIKTNAQTCDGRIKLIFKLDGD